MNTDQQYSLIGTVINAGMLVALHMYGGINRRYFLISLLYLILAQISLNVYLSGKDEPLSDLAFVLYFFIASLPIINAFVGVVPEIDQTFRYVGLEMV